MEMTDVKKHLQKLQDILVEKYAIEQEIEDAPKTLSAQDELLSKMKKEYIAGNTQYEELQERIVVLRRELDEAVAARERGEKGMDSITTHREYEALEKEIKEATQKENELRSELQKEEKIFEDKAVEMDRKKQAIDTQQVELDSKKASIESTINSLNAKLEELQRQEEEIVPGLDPEIVFKFERIIKSKQNKGIVAVKGNVCDGCHMILPAQFANIVRNDDEIVFCPYCSRILDYEEQDDTENEFFNIEDAGSLVGLDDENFDDESEESDEDDRDEVKEMDFDNLYS